MSATTTKQNGKPPGEAAADVRASGAQFPRNTLTESLRVAEAIERANGGQPYPPTETAIAMGLSPASSVFRTLLASSSKRGLTSGSHMAKKIMVLAPGRDIVAPTSEEGAAVARLRAALAPPLFQALYNHFQR